MILFFRTPSKSVIAVESNHQLTPDESNKLCWLFGEAVMESEENLKGCFVGPRREMITPWSTNAVEITQNMGLEGISRIEEYFPVKDENADYDPMLQRMYKGLDQNVFTTNRQPEPIIYIEDLEVYNEKEGLALSKEEMDYLKKVEKDLGRKLTDSEVFGFAQINSEHCRHKIFGGTFIIDGVEQESSLFQMIKKTTQENPNKIISAYKDNVAFAEVMHTALAYFQAGRTDAGFKLLKSSILDGMYLGESPANFGQISFYDAARGECYRDFGDPIGVASRVLIQGLYGILPDAMNERLLVKPGLPSAWSSASLHTPDIDFDFQRGDKEGVTSYVVTHRLPAVRTLELQFPAQRSKVAKLTINGKPATWTLVEKSITRPMLSVVIPASSGEETDVRIEWGGEELSSPASVSPNVAYAEAPVCFVPMQQDEMKWWYPVDRPQSEANQSLIEPSTFTQVHSAKCEPVVMDTRFNSSVTDIFRNEYLSPRSPYTTLQIPKQGIGEWCHPLHTVDINDAGLRSSVQNGILNTELGIPFRTPAEGHNVAFTSLWDNYPDSLEIPLKGKASRAYLLMAGSTNHMQCHIDNGVIRVYYKDGSCDVMSLRNPDNWPPIEHIFFEDGLAFNRHTPALYRLRLKTGEISNNFGEELGFPGASRELDGGAAVLLEMPLNPGKKLSHLVLETLSNDVVIGLMSITLQR